MPATVYGPYIFGFNDSDPFPLPNGWQWVKDPEDWLTAIGPDGKRYIATKDELHLLKYSAPELAEENPKNYRPQEAGSFKGLLTACIHSAVTNPPQ